MASVDAVAPSEGVVPTPEFSAMDLTNTNMLAEELSMQIIEGAKSLVDSRKAYHPAETNVDSKNKDGYPRKQSADSERDRRKGSLSSNSGSESGEKNDDSSIDSDDSNDRNQDSSDCDENTTKNNKTKTKSNSASNSISSDSAYDDKFSEDKQSRTNDLERRVNSQSNMDAMDGIKTRNVHFDEGSDQESQDNDDSASQTSSDSNQSEDNSISNVPRKSVYDNNAFENDENPRPKRRAPAGVTFAVASPKDDDDDDDIDGFGDEMPNDDSFEEDDKKAKKKIDKKEWQRRQDFISAVTSLLSLMYGGMVILLGFVFPLTEALHSQWLTTTSVAVFNVYLYIVSTVFLIYMSLDIWSWIDHYFPRDKGPPVPRGRRGGASQQGSDDDSEDSDSCHSMTNEIYDEVMGLRQTASLSNEGASFYLRLGALLFGIANFIYVVVQIDQYYNQLSYDCYDRPAVYPMYCHLIFVGVQTFYIFKDTTVKVRRYRSVARFGFMHVLATNMCNWIRILVFEVMEGMYKTQKDIAKRTKLAEMALKNASYDDHGYGHGNDSGYDSHDDHGKSGYDDHGYDDHGYGHGDGNYSQVSCLHLEGLYMSIAPYLFPFVLEYSLIAAATMAGMYQSLNIRVTADVLSAVKKSVMNRRKSSADLGALLQSKQESENMFAKSHRGMYLGAILLAGALVSMIMFHYTVSGEKNSDDEFKALEIYLLSDIALHVVLIPPVVYVAVRFSKFKFSFNKENTIDDTLLLISLSGLVLYYAFVILTTTTGVLFLEEEPIHQNHRTTALSVVYAFCNIFQSVIQGIFVIAGLQLCAPTRKQALDKPGRGAITFLLIGNLSLWLFKSFQVKEVAIHRYVDFFGPVAWPILQNTCLPLVLFYRFHVSVCLADIWVSVYKPETGPQHKMLH